MKKGNLYQKIQDLADESRQARYFRQQVGYINLKEGKTCPECREKTLVNGRCLKCEATVKA